MDLDTLSLLEVWPADICVEERSRTLWPNRGKHSNKKDKPTTFGNGKQADLAGRHTHNVRGTQDLAAMTESSAFETFW